MNIVIPDIDPLIVHLLDIPELLHMMSTNKYFHGIIIKMPLYIQWEYVSNRYNPKTSVELIFLHACEKGYLEYARSLFNRYDIDLHCNMEYPFQMCCLSGNLNICKWFIALCEKLDSKVDIHADSELAFIWSFENLEISKWLIELGEKSYGRININSIYGDYELDAFSECCVENYFEAAKYLIHLGENCGYDRINVHAFDNYVICQNNGHTEMANWLLTLENTYGVFKKN